LTCRPICARSVGISADLEDGQRRLTEAHLLPMM
jgi:hypothetical protein